MAKITSINPSNKKVIGEVDISTSEDIGKTVDKARKAMAYWKDLGVEKRVDVLRRVIVGFEKRKNELAKLASSEMGMPLILSKADIDDAMNYFRGYLNDADECLSPEVVYQDDKTKHTVYREPIGVSANITPWNFPASNFIWSVGQSLISGNVVIYKTSENVPLCGKLIEEIMEKSKLPDGVFSEVYGDGKVGRKLVDSDIDLICFTGSTKTGKYLYKVASEKFIKIFLELGGSAPGIVFDDADLDRIIGGVFENRFYYCGQVCDGLKRLIVQESIFDKTVDKLVEKIRKVKIGDALLEDTELGPLVSEDQLIILENQVNDAIKKGAKVLIGGKRLNKLGGYFYAPTILTNIKKNMSVWSEEVFGPVLPIVTFKSEEEAIKLASNTRYGLGGYIFTEDKKRANKIAQKMETGMVSVNNASYLKSCSPFGGYKESGIGREHGKYGFNNLTQVKIVAEEI